MNKLAILLFLLLPLSLFAQRNQLVLIKNDEVVIRYGAGDNFNYKRKSGERKTGGFIVEINDSTIITSIDTVATHQIEKVFFSKGNMLNVLGGALVTGGVLIFVIDEFNTMVVDGNDFYVDERVANISLTSIAIGLPLLLLKKKSHRVGFKQRLRIVDRESLFYYSESRFRPKGYISPSIPRN